MHLRALSLDNERGSTLPQSSFPGGQCGLTGRNHCTLLGARVCLQSGLPPGSKPQCLGPRHRKGEVYGIDLHRVRLTSNLRDAGVTCTGPIAMAVAGVRSGDKEVDRRGV